MTKENTSSTGAQSQELILYHYKFSPYAKRVVWYLNLRKIPYTQCLQPPILPRPDTIALGTHYRRIPILSIGLDIYLDTRLILSKLEDLYPASTSYPALSPSPSDQGLTQLLSIWTIETLFAKAAALIPSDMPLAKDARFRKDREDFSGRSWDEADRERKRAEALVDIRGAFELLETTFFADGRDWVLGGERPGLGDVEGLFAFVLWGIPTVWPFHWLQTLHGALPPDHISPAHFPKVFSWISRFQFHVSSLASANRPRTIKGDEALRITHAASFAEPSIGVDEQDPSGLRAGERVEVWPTDSGSAKPHRDRGRLVGLSAKEAVVETEGQGVKGVRVHTPRRGFRVRRLPEGRL
ncbi:hypothetical protein PZA11_003692 [Diplocarpon coronariae]